MSPRFLPAVLLALAACAPKPEPEAAAAPQEVLFTATDFAFSGPDSIAPGLTTIRVTNQGSQDHHLILGRLDDGKTMQDLLAFFQATPDAEPRFISWRGAGSAIAPGDTTGSTNDLPAGRYVLICFVPDPVDHRPHATKGMVRELVVAGPAATAPTPTAHAEIRLSDFTFTSPTLSAGTHTIHVVNDGPQTHEVQLVRLNDGATAAQFLSAMAPGAAAPPPGNFAGGPGALSPGVDQYWTVDLEPGNYLFVCFVPDTADGKPHIVKGMVREFSVPAT